MFVHIFFGYTCGNNHNVLRIQQSVPSMPDPMRKRFAKAQAARNKAMRSGITRPHDRTHRHEKPETAAHISRRVREVRRHTNGIVPHDKAFRHDAKRRKLRHVAKSVPLTDSSTCDVSQYHHARESKQQDAGSDKAVARLFRWMEFERTYCADGEWRHPRALETTPSTNQSGLLAYYRRADTPHTVHRALIARCKVEVWQDKGLERYVAPPPPPLQAAGSADPFRCALCASPLKRTRFHSVCAACGHAKAAVSAKDRNVKEMEFVQRPAPAYKRGNHMHEWLTRIQAAERKVVPVEVRKAVEDRFDKWGFDKKNPSRELVRRFLRDAGYQRYFEHIPQIMRSMSGAPPITFTHIEVAKIKQIFSAIQEPFEKHKPANRKNFLSYSYVLYKVCELLELDEHLQHFSLLKSRANLMKADRIWKGICKECNFVYIPTT